MSDELISNTSVLVKPREKNGSVRATRPNHVTITMEDFARRVMEDAEALRSADPALFLHVAKEIAAKAKETEVNLTGENHPLAGFLARKRDDDFLERLDEGIAEYRALIDTADKQKS